MNLCYFCHLVGHPKRSEPCVTGNKIVVGVCDRCESENMPLIYCTKAEFRTRPMTSIAMEGPAHYATIEDLTR